MSGEAQIKRAILKNRCCHECANENPYSYSVLLTSPPPALWEFQCKGKKSVCVENGREAEESDAVGG